MTDKSLIQILEDLSLALPQGEGTGNWFGFSCCANSVLSGWESGRFSFCRSGVWRVKRITRIDALKSEKQYGWIG